MSHAIHKAMPSVWQCICPIAGPCPAYPLAVLTALLSSNLISLNRTLTAGCRPKSIADVLEQRADPEATYKMLCKEFVTLSPIEQTAALIYITKHSYGSLLRFSANKRRHTSVYRKQIQGMNWSNYDKAAKYLCESHILVVCKDFVSTMQRAEAGDFVFLDPPYFIANIRHVYFKNTLAPDDLCNIMNTLHNRGCMVLFIHNTDSTLDQKLIGYKRYPFEATESFVTAKTRQESVYINYRL